MSLSGGWSDLVKAGYTWTYAVQIEGIPHVFIEKAIPRVDSTSGPSLPSGYDSAIECLSITDGAKVSINIDRMKGCASGDAFDLVLGWQGLEDSALTTGMFSAPATSITIAENVDTSTGSIEVVDTTGWTASHGYIGIERVALSVVDGTHVNLTSRGLSGSLANKYVVRSPSYKMITDKPVIWRGRNVTIWRHLLSPDKRILDDQWCDTVNESSGERKYCRILWRGYIDQPPRPSKAGLVLRCLPLVRKVELPLGHKVKGKTLAMEIGDDEKPLVGGFPVKYIPSAPLASYRWRTDDGLVNISGDFLANANTGVATASRVLGEDVYWDLYGLIAATAIGTPWAREPEFFAGQVSTNPNIPATGHYVRFIFGVYDEDIDQSNTYIDVLASSQYWLVPGRYYWTKEFDAHDFGSKYVLRLPLRLDPPSQGLPGYWLPIVREGTNEWNDVTWPSAGYAVIGESGAGIMIEWDAIDDGPWFWYENSDVSFLHVKRVIGAAPGDPLGVLDSIAVNYVTGFEGVGQVILATLLQSSGAGNRGTWDVLALGQGLGIHEDLMDMSTAGAQVLPSTAITLFSEGKQSIIGLLGGHFALRGACLVQYCTDPDRDQVGQAIKGSHAGDCILAFVGFDAGVAEASATTIGLDECILEAIDAPEPADSPNSVQVAVELPLSGQAHTVTIQDLPRIQGEGARVAEYAAPGMTEGEAAQMAMTVIRRGDGESILSLTLAPWVEIQPGDLVNLTIAHPVTYDFASGQRSPASIGARCLGWSADLFTGTQRVTLLLAGLDNAVGPLCPSPAIYSVDSGTQVTVLALFIIEGYFVDGDEVLLYLPGDEQGSTPKSVQMTISDIEDDSTSSTRQITFSTSLPAWVNTSTRMTYPLTADCTDAQAAFTHNETGSKLT